MPLIAPSVLSADFANLQKDVRMLNESQADWIHVDIMDGIFVPNISFGLPVTEAISRHATKPLDVHLMIQEPDRYLTAFQRAGAAHITVHMEACTHLHRTVEAIKELGLKAGVAINPHTAVGQLEAIASDLDIVLLMSVNPGFGGQRFIAHTYDKLTSLCALRQRLQASFLIEVDGGVTDQNAEKLTQAGADVLVAGSFVFSSNDPTATIRSLK